MGFFSKLLSVGESKPLKNYQRRVAEVNAFEPAMQARSDEELAHLTVEFRERLANGEDLDDLLPEAFAAVREASVRTTGLRHFEAEPSDSGTDASEMQIQRGGCATGLVSIPLRYMHTPTEVVKLSDIEDTVTLLKRFILDLDEDVSFVPGM